MSIVDLNTALWFCIICHPCAQIRCPMRGLRRCNVTGDRSLPESLKGPASANTTCGFEVSASHREPCCWSICEHLWIWYFQQHGLSMASKFNIYSRPHCACDELGAVPREQAATCNCKGIWKNWPQTHIDPRGGVPLQQIPTSTAQFHLSAALCAPSEIAGAKELGPSTLGWMCSGAIAMAWYILIDYWQRVNVLDATST